jgi:hypothetical protein
LRIAEHPKQSRQGVEEAIDHSLLEWDDGIVGDRDVFRADLGAALCDVTQAHAELFS